MADETTGTHTTPQPDTAPETAADPTGPITGATAPDLRAAREQEILRVLSEDVESGDMGGGDTESDTEEESSPLPADESTDDVVVHETVEEAVDADELDLELVWRAKEAGITKEQVLSMEPATLKAVVEFAESRMEPGEKPAAKPGEKKPEAKAEPGETLPEWEDQNFLTDEVRERLEDDPALLSVFEKMQETVNNLGKATVAERKEAAELRQRIADEETARAVAESEKWFAEHEDFFGAGTLHDLAADSVEMKRRQELWARGAQEYNWAEKAGHPISIHEALSRADRVLNPKRSQQQKADARNKGVRGRRVARSTRRSTGTPEPESDNRPSSKEDLRQALHQVYDDVMPT